MTTVSARSDISVVISTYNRAGVLPRAIQSLLEQDLNPAQFEIVIVDNNSTDSTRQAVEFFTGKTRNLRYVFEPRQGVYCGRNAGIRAARASCLVFTDDDVRVSPTGSPPSCESSRIIRRLPASSGGCCQTGLAHGRTASRGSTGGRLR